MQVRAGVFGGHRLLPQTRLILSRVAAWPQDHKDLEKWIEKLILQLPFSFEKLNTFQSPAFPFNDYSTNSALSMNKKLTFA